MPRSRAEFLPVRQALLPAFTLRVPSPWSQMILAKPGGDGWLINLAAGALA
jgi:hypothetical protein